MHMRIRILRRFRWCDWLDRSERGILPQERSSSELAALGVGIDLLMKGSNPCVECLLVNLMVTHFERGDLRVQVGEEVTNGHDHDDELLPGGFQKIDE